MFDDAQTTITVNVRFPPKADTILWLNPIVDVISGFRWSFYSVADVPVWSSVAVTLGIIGACLAVIAWMFRTGYRLKQ